MLSPHRKGSHRAKEEIIPNILLTEVLKIFLSILARPYQLIILNIITITGMSHFVTFSKTWKALTKLVSSLIFYLVDMNGYQRENIKEQILDTQTTPIFI